MSRSRAQAWCRDDPNPTTVQYVQDLLARTAATTTTSLRDGEEAKGQTLTTATNPSGEHEELVLLLSKLFPVSSKDDETEERIGFGTAGLRAAMMPGPMGMNDLVVIQTAQGLARYVESLSNQTSGRHSFSVVIGYDHRAVTNNNNNNMTGYNLSSRQFAIWTALVFRHCGWEVLLLHGFVPTPLVPFLVKTRGAALGIMVTASHNPKQDAGYKVYWEDSCQIRAPIDTGIAQSILQNLQPWMDYRKRWEDQSMQYPQDPCLGLAQSAEPFMEQYLRAIQESGLLIPANVTAKVSDKIPQFCYTAMHGVGYSFVEQAFRRLGLPRFYSVPPQQHPDPDFPTVIFPNPEEKGALDLAMKYATDNQCDIILANDPDADRLAVAERDENCHSWTIFTGDQIGGMLGLWLWERYRDGDRKVAMCVSTVSSKLLKEIGRVEGFRVEETLTGFKWIGSRASELCREGYRSIFAYEEAIGFCCGDIVFDKDGISAMCVMAQLAMHVYAQGLTLKQHLQHIYDTYGEFVSNNGYYFLKHPSQALQVMNNMCNILQVGAMDIQRHVGPYSVSSIRYLGEPGFDSTTLDRKPTLPTSISSPMMTVHFANGCVAQFRASGTEPKFKYYIEMKGTPGRSRDQVTNELLVVSELVLEALVQPSEYGLTRGC